jgi:cellulose biosynthesis protein BcsQ
MRTIAFFNNKGGVGKTSLVYHVSWMLAELGVRTLAADFDPQANLTSMFLDDEALEQIWQRSERPTIYGAVSPQFRGIGDVRQPEARKVTDRLALLVGDLELSRFEDDLSQNWPKCADGDERAFRVTSALGRALTMAGGDFGAEVALVDVGPNLGALNRAALLACDFVVVPLGADLFSLQGLRNMGPTLRDWRRLWDERKPRNPDRSLDLPAGAMQPVGYIVMRHSVFAGRPAKAFEQWIRRIPGQYRESVLDAPAEQPDDPGQDPNCLARLKDYRSLMPLAQEARKPMFLLRPADGAFGSHYLAVQECHRDFNTLARKILERCAIAVPAVA